MAADELTHLLDKMNLGSASKIASKGNVTVDDIDMMSVDEISSTLGVTRDQAKNIKKERENEVGKHDAFKDYDKDTENLEPNTPLGSEQSFDWSKMDTSGPVPQSHSVLPNAAAPATYHPHTVNVDNSTLQRYAQSLHIIKEAVANNTEVKLAEEEVKLKGLEDIARCKQTEYDDLEKSLAYAKSKLKVSGSGGIVGRVIHGTMSGPSQQQKDDLQAAAQLQYDECAKKVVACKAVLDEAKSSVVQQDGIVKKLRAEVAKVTEAKQFEADLAHTLFSGAAGDDKENMLEAEVNKIAPQVEQAKKAIVNFTGVREKLNSALKKFEQAEDKWSNAKSLSRKNWLWSKITGSKGNVALDLARTSQSQAALALTHSGLLDLTEAKQAIPDLPKLELAQLQEYKTTHFKNCFVDITIPNKQHESDLKKNIKLINAVEKQANNAVKWIEKWNSGRLEPNLAKIEAEYRVKKDQLDSHRRVLLEQELAKRGIKAPA